MRVCAALIVGCILTATALAEEGDTLGNTLDHAKEWASVRKAMEDGLIEMVLDSSKDPKVTTRRREAVSLLGTIGTERCVPALLRVLNDYMDPENTTGVVPKFHMTIPATPAMRALVEIGPRAIGPMLDAFTSESQPVLRNAYLQAIAMLDCRDLVLAILEERVIQASDAIAAERLRSAYFCLGGKMLK